MTDTTKQTALQFFAEQTDPETARILANAEAWGEGRGVRYDWTDASEPYGDKEPDWKEYPRMWLAAVLPCIHCGGDGRTAYLGSIALKRGGDDYARVAEAELALELMDFGPGR